MKVNEVWDTSPDCLTYSDISDSEISEGVTLIELTKEDLYSCLNDPDLFKKGNNYKHQDLRKIEKVRSEWSAGKPLTPSLFKVLVRSNKLLALDGKHRLSVSISEGVNEMITIAILGGNIDLISVEYNRIRAI